MGKAAVGFGYSFFEGFLEVFEVFRFHHRIVSIHGVLKIDDQVVGLGSQKDSK
jgi:hypothetical protein